MLGTATAVGVEARREPAPLAEGVELASGRPMAAPKPGTPLLLLANPQARPDFSLYLAEILRTEGLVGFQRATVGEVGASDLAHFSVVVLGSGPLTEQQIGFLQAYVVNGGALVGVRPAPVLATLFGVRYLGADAQGDYLHVSQGVPEVDSFDTGPLQFHGRYDQLECVGASLIASTAVGTPLVTLHHFGRGMTALWAFDLAQSIALTRQGNPTLADQDRDSIPGVRASDLFVGWIDPERIGIPQADEHQRLFVRIIERLAENSTPLPRLWYFPNNASAVLVTTGDAHGSRVSHIEQVLGIVERHGGTASIYYTPPHVSVVRRLAQKARWTVEQIPGIGGLVQTHDPSPTPVHVAAWRTRGHEFGMHPYVETSLEAGYNEYWNEFIKYGYGPLPPTVRTHRVLWHGWVDNALVQARYGLRMNLDYYHSGSTVRKPDGTWMDGYLNGTGLPMRFVTTDGALLSVYQQPTHLVDEHLIRVFDTGYEVGLSGAAAAVVSINQIAASVLRFPAALGLQCHVDPFLIGGTKAENVSRWLTDVLSYANAQGVPILSAERWLAFTETRAAARVFDLRWDAGRRSLSFALELPSTGAGGMTLLLPVRHSRALVRGAQVNGMTATRGERTIAGMRYIAVAVAAGYQQIEVNYAG